MKKELLTDTAKLGTLSSFIELLNKVQNEFKLQTISIGAINSNDRDMYAKLTGDLAILEIDYNYCDEKCYISITTNYEDSKQIKLMKKSIKDFMEQN